MMKQVYEKREFSIARLTRRSSPYEPLVDVRLLFAPEAYDVAVRVSDGAPVAHSAADSFPLLEYSSAETLCFLLHRWYGVNGDVECG
jgi:hypothetical protein